MLPSFRIGTTKLQIEVWARMLKIDPERLEAELTPDYKHGQPHKWTNGFVSFMVHNHTVNTTTHKIIDGMFNVAGKIYDSK